MSASWEVRRLARPDRPCSLLQDLRIRPGTRNEFATLEGFHYRAASRELIIRAIYVAELQREIVGAIVYVNPIINLAPRSIVLPMYRGQGSAHAHRVNRDFERIARVVVLPKYRSIGLGVKLVADTMPLRPRPYIETLAVMAWYHPFFQRAEMRAVDIDCQDPDLTKALLRLSQLGFDVELLGSRTYTSAILAQLSPSEIAEVQHIVLEHFLRAKFRSQALVPWVRLGKPSALAEALTLAQLPARYLLWKNPAYPDYPEPCWAVAEQRLSLFPKPSTIF